MERSPYLSAPYLNPIKVVFWGIILCLAGLVSLPNFLGEYVAVQLKPKSGHGLTTLELTTKAVQLLEANNLSVVDRRLLTTSEGIDLCFKNVKDQLKAKQLLEKNWSQDCMVALSSVPKTPRWLAMLGAKPLKLGLDLRGGVHLQLAIDLDGFWPQYLQQQSGLVRSALSDKLKIAPLDLTLNDARDRLIVTLPAATDLAKVKQLLTSQFSHFNHYEIKTTKGLRLALVLNSSTKDRLKEQVITQTLQVVQNRVNELGVSEAVVQRLNDQNLSVDLPGLQDIARAKEILGKTASIRFQLVADIAGTSSWREGYESFYYQGNQILLQPEVVLDGSSITYAVAGTDQWNRPAVQVELDGAVAKRFLAVTSANIGKPLATIYSQVEKVCRDNKGKHFCFNSRDERIINVATIRSALENRFEITGLTSLASAEELALLLRSGSLMAPLSVVREAAVGPSMGADNIRRGAWSLLAGLMAIAVFMVLYYRGFGLIANITLVLNLIFMLALLTMLDATLTMAGIAGVVLTIGMAVDASILIFERIREELKQGVSGAKAVQLGYQRALVAILDSNLSTLIISAVLFSLGSGVVRGFAVTLTIGILTSILTAVVYSRLMVEIVLKWGGKRFSEQLPIGIKTA